MTAQRHGTMQPERIKDPFLGWRYVLVGCDWCGAKGRYVDRATAQTQADRHNNERRGR